MIKRGKKGQIMGMPFQFIFSLILIAVALFVAFWAIRGFLERAEQANIGSFVVDVKGNVNDMWSGEEAEMIPTFSFSAKFNNGRVCFLNLSAICRGENSDVCSTVKDMYCYTKDDDVNFFLVDKDGMMDVAGKYGLSPAWKVEHINITEENPVCYYVESGKVTMNLTKGAEYRCSGQNVCVWPISS